MAVGAQIPSNIPPEGEWVCYTLRAPDTPEWRALVLGVLRLLSFKYYWDKETGDIDAAVAAGQLIWRSFALQDGCEQVSADFCQAVIDALAQSNGDVDLFLAALALKLLESCEQLLSDAVLDLVYGAAEDET